MRTVAIRHVAFEDLGAWASVLRGRGHDVEYLDAGDDLGRAREADLVVVLGGPIGVADADRYPFLREEVDLVRGRLEADLPTLGVCLGAQIMAAALGAPVFPGPEKEIGWGRLSLAPEAGGTALEALRDAPVLHWHGDTFDLPSGAVGLASSRPTPHQAFSVGRSLALQFHAEVVGGTIERWLVGHAVELAHTGVDVARLRADSERHALPAARAGRALLERYLEGLSPAS